ncbi:MAG: hypothetical protein ACXQS4_04020 [Methermicoccaceae archaeon]
MNRIETLHIEYTISSPLSPEITARVIKEEVLKKGVDDIYDTDGKHVHFVVRRGADNRYTLMRHGSYHRYTHDELVEELDQFIESVEAELNRLYKLKTDIELLNPVQHDRSPKLKEWIDVVEA